MKLIPGKLYKAKKLMPQCYLKNKKGAHHIDINKGEILLFLYQESDTIDDCAILDLFFLSPNGVVVIVDFDVSSKELDRLVRGNIEEIKIS